MRELTFDEIKQSEFRTLKIFHDFCERNELTYYITYGTLLGAVRHRGFIPWDDNIDVMMPRKDYNILLKKFNKRARGNRYVISKEIAPRFYDYHAKIFDAETVLKEDNSDMDIGVFINVYPIDVMPSSKLIRKIFLGILSMMKLLIDFKKQENKKRRGGESIWQKIALGFKNILPPVKVQEKRMRKFMQVCRNKKRPKYYGLTYRILEGFIAPKFKTSYFNEPITLDFCGKKFYAPKEYDKFLTYVYGDYMTYPPIENRISKHNYRCYERPDFRQ